MYQGRFEPARRACEPRRRGGKGRMTMMVLSTLLLLALAIGGTVAWLTTNTDGITNTFTPSEVKCEVQESFNGTTKSNVTVKNTSDIDAYIRVKLISYRVNADKQHIGGTTTIPSFKPGDGWVALGGYYYYIYPVPKDTTISSNLISSITMTDYTNVDADGGYLAIDVMAEAIQSQPAQAVKDAWGIDVVDNHLSIG